ncbi:MAG: hypothetical protein EOM80_03705 [Erysipelotrichia bacterium]|nr:hypothetical protein [Candidatus Riflebacteria bacterium]NCB37852.1 hypothetical protein [Erysipelotrichia bacterium]
MERTIMAILVGKRKETAVNVQKILTGWGCMIKTRLGLHDGTLDNCAESGLIILELVGESEKKDELLRKLSLLEDVSAKLIKLSLDK